MRNQNFPWFLQLFLLPFLPIVWLMNRQSDGEILEEIRRTQALEAGRRRPVWSHLQYTAEQILHERE